MLPAIHVNLQKRSRARIVAQRQSNPGNDLFASFLDPNWQYSRGHFQRTDSLEQAQPDKLAMICGKLELKESDRLLDIGVHYDPTLMAWNEGYQTLIGSS